MRIMALDLGARAGFAEGETGTMPTISAIVLKRPKDEAEDAAANLACFLRDRFALGLPDILVTEHYMQPAAQRAQDVTIVHLLLHGAVRAVAGCYGVRVESPYPQEVRKHFCGQPRANMARRAKGSPARTSREQRLDREATKRMVWDRAVLLGYLSRSAPLDHDKADAASIFDYAAARWGRVTPPRLVMFGEAGVAA